MHATIALLDRTRIFYDIGNRTSLLFSTDSNRLRAFVDGGKRIADNETKGQKPRQPPRKQMAWSASAFLAPAAFGPDSESLDSSPTATERVEHGARATASRDVAFDRSAQSSSSSVTMPATFQRHVDQNVALC